VDARELLSCGILASQYIALNDKALKLSQRSKAKTLVILLCSQVGV